MKLDRSLAILKLRYASNEIVHWLTTLADSFRVAADLGAVRFAFRAFRKAIFIFKGRWHILP